MNKRTNTTLSRSEAQPDTNTTPPRLRTPSLHYDHRLQYIFFYTIVKIVILPTAVLLLSRTTRYTVYKSTTIATASMKPTNRHQQARYSTPLVQSVEYASRLFSLIKQIRVWSGIQNKYNTHKSDPTNKEQPNKTYTSHTETGHTVADKYSQTYRDFSQTAIGN